MVYVDSLENKHEKFVKDHIFRFVDDTSSRAEYGRRFPALAADIEASMRKRGAELFAAVDSEKETVVGYIGVVERLSPGAIEAEIIQLFVWPPSRRSGVGTLLMDKAVAWARARSATNIRVVVSPSNATAISLYKRMQFQDESLVLCRSLA